MPNNKRYIKFIFLKKVSIKKEPNSMPIVIADSNIANVLNSALKTSLTKTGIPIIAGPIIKKLFKLVIQIILVSFLFFLKNKKPKIRSSKYECLFELINLFFNFINDEKTDDSRNNIADT